MKSKTSHRKNFIKNKISGKVFPTPAEYKSKACIIETDLEALNIEVDSEKKSIEVLSQLVAGEKKMNVRVVSNHHLTNRREKIFGGFRRVEAYFDSRESLLEV